MLNYLVLFKCKNEEGYSSHKTLEEAEQHFTTMSQYKGTVWLRLVKLETETFEIKKFER